MDEEIGPLALASARISNHTWGLLMRTGNDKSHLRYQLERYADIYTSRVSQLLPRNALRLLALSARNAPTRSVNGRPYLFTKRYGLPLKSRNNLVRDFPELLPEFWVFCVRARLGDITISEKRSRSSPRICGSRQINLGRGTLCGRFQKQRIENRNTVLRTGFKSRAKLVAITPGCRA
ncbi:unnamed protein product [Sphagnum jensenii]|uniref:Uncharacterized protein n=1 Tax=Sphagnum jensenii TaxID=128206 RepID=A0ABP0V766_9BRYO